MESTIAKAAPRGIAVIRQKHSDDGREPKAAGLKLRPSQAQQENRLKPSTAMQQEKRTFMQNAAKSQTPMSELRTKQPDADAANFVVNQNPNRGTTRGTAARLPESGHSIRPKPALSKAVVRCDGVGCLSCGAAIRCGIRQ